MSVTRVPILPIAKGSLTKLWIGVILVLAAGAGLAWASTAGVRGAITTTESGVRVITLEEGEAGVSPSSGDIALVSYEGRLEDGTVFDANPQAPLSLASPDDPAIPGGPGPIIPGLREGMLTMEKGGRYRVLIPADQAYGDTASPTIPANSNLEFEIELIDFRSLAEIEAQFRAMQQQQQQLVGPGGPGAGGLPTGPAPAGPQPSGPQPGGPQPGGPPQPLPGQ